VAATTDTNTELNNLPVVIIDAGPELPDVLGRDRATHAGKHTLVVGAGHSATNTLINLAELARQEPGTRCRSQPSSRGQRPRTR